MWTLTWVVIDEYSPGIRGISPNITLVYHSNPFFNCRFLNYFPLEIFHFIHIIFQIPTIYFQIKKHFPDSKSSFRLPKVPNTVMLQCYAQSEKCIFDEWSIWLHTIRYRGDAIDCEINIGNYRFSSVKLMSIRFNSTRSSIDALF